MIKYFCTFENYEDIIFEILKDSLINIIAKHTITNEI